MNRVLALALVACQQDPTVPTTGTTGDTGGTTIPTTPFYSDDALAAILAAAEDDLDASLATGAQIAVWHAGELVYTASLGTKDPAGTALVDDETLFQIGSDTKKMTAIAVLQQVEAGNVSLTAPLSAALPSVDLVESPDWADQVTVHDLISHQGGLFDWTPWEPAADDTQLRSIAEGEFAAAEWAMADPGVFYNYSNPNFSIAGLVAEDAAGVPWADLVTERIFAPLAMDHTFARLSEVVDYGNYATGTGLSFDGAVDWFNPLVFPAYSFGPVPIEEMVDHAFVRPAGLVWSTASDQARYLGEFWIRGDEDVLSDELRTAATTMQVAEYPSIPIQGYGYGWMVLTIAPVGIQFYDTPMILHGGNTMSETSLTWAFPEKELAISILSNGFGDDFDHTATVLAQKSGLLTDTTVPTGLVVTESDHAELVGDYTDHFFGVMQVTDVGGALNVTVPLLDDLGVSYDPVLEYAGYQDVYLVTVDGQLMDLTFLHGEGGGYEWLRNRSFVGQRGAAPVASHADRAAVLGRLHAPQFEPASPLVRAALR